MNVTSIYSKLFIAVETNFTQFSRTYCLATSMVSQTKSVLKRNSFWKEKAGEYQKAGVHVWPISMSKSSQYACILLYFSIVKKPKTNNNAKMPRDKTNNQSTTNVSHNHSREATLA